MPPGCSSPKIGIIYSSGVSRRALHADASSRARLVLPDAGRPTIMNILAAPPDLSPRPPACSDGSVPRPPAPAHDETTCLKRSRMQSRRSALRNQDRTTVPNNGIPTAVGHADWRHEWASFPACSVTVVGPEIRSRAVDRRSSRRDAGRSVRAVVVHAPFATLQALRGCLPRVWLRYDDPAAL